MLLCKYNETFSVCYTLKAGTVINPYRVMNNLFIWDQLEQGRIFNKESIGVVCAGEAKLTLSDSYIAFLHVLEISTW